MVRKIQTKQVVLLRSHGMSGRGISTSQGITSNSIAEVFEAADCLELSWDHLKEKLEGEVYSLLFPSAALTKLRAHLNMRHYAAFTSTGVNPVWHNHARWRASTDVVPKVTSRPSRYADLLCGQA